MSKPQGCNAVCDSEKRVYYTRGGAFDFFLNKTCSVPGYDHDVVNAMLFQQAQVP
jgi:hypothetical protein